MVNLRRYFPKGSEGDFLWYCFVHYIDPEDFKRILAEEKAAKDKPEISFEEAVAELEAEKQIKASTLLQQ